MLRLPGLRAMRERAILTQRELAARSGISRPTIARLEGGASGAYPSTIRKLATVLGVEPRMLVAAPPTTGAREEQ